MVCVSAGTWRFRWGTWACLTPQRSITEASSSLIWKRPWLNWATICSASSFTCTGESIETHGKKVQPEIVFFLSCHVLLFSSSMILALINDWSTPDPSALRPPPRAICSHKPACRMQSDQRSACCVCCHQFHFMTLVKSGVSGTVHCCNSNKKNNHDKKPSVKSGQSFYFLHCCFAVRLFFNFLYRNSFPWNPNLFCQPRIYFIWSLKTSFE